METRATYSTAIDPDGIIESLFTALAENEEKQLRIGEISKRLSEAKDELALAQAMAVDAGYASGRITGKNAEERGRAETILLSSNKEYQTALTRTRNLEFEYELAKTEADLASKRVGAWHQVSWAKSAQMLHMAASLAGHNGAF